ncbi:29240_t:CDS:2, partial [Racocetra persica]
NIEIIETGGKRSSESSTSLVVRRMKKYSIQSQICQKFQKKKKNPAKDLVKYSKNELSSKKVKTKDRNLSMLKKLIKKLKSSIQLLRAEERIESVNQEIIICYFAFGKKLKERSQRKLYEEVEKQLLSNLSKNTIEKKIERARKIYDLFSSIGEDKIQRVSSYSALRISKLSWDEINAIEEEFE